LKTLAKIDGIGLKDIERLKNGGWKTHFNGRPTLRSESRTSRVPDKLMTAARKAILRLT